MEQIADTMNFDQKAKGEIRLAIIEACINAFEHSKSKDKRVYLTVKVEDEKLTTIIQDRGQGFNPKGIE